MKQIFVFSRNSQALFLDQLKQWEERPHHVLGNLQPLVLQHRPLQVLQTAYLRTASRRADYLLSDYLLDHLFLHGLASSSRLGLPVCGATAQFRVS